MTVRGKIHFVEMKVDILIRLVHSFAEPTLLIRKGEFLEPLRDLTNTIV